MTASTRWVDTHCHVDDESALEVFDRARAAGVDACFVIGTDEESSERAVRVARRLPPQGGAWPVRFAAVGLHPHEASVGTSGVARLIRSEVTPIGEGRAPGSVVAVGECGLDYYYEHSPKPAQRTAFGEQIALANEHDLSLVVHTRDAWDDTYAILVDHGVPARTIIHCFSGPPEVAERFVELGAYLSFSGIVTFPSAEEVRASAVLCPSDRLLLETDAPYLAPVPHRGRPNEPAYVGVTGALVADLRGEDAAELADRTRANAMTAFAARW